MENKENLTDEQITKALESGKRGSTGGKVLIGIGCLILIIGFFAGCSIPLIVIGAAIALLGEAIQSKKNSAVQKQLHDTVVQDALHAVFADATLDVSRHITAAKVKESGIPLPAYSYVGGSEYMEATYKGLDVELSSVNLTELEEYEHEETGMRERTERTVYSGQWLVCNLGTEAPVSLTIWPRGKLDKLLRLATIKTEDENFNQRFNLSADNPTTALAFLNPARMEQFLALADTAGGGLSVSLHGDTLYLAVQSGHGFFHSGKGHEDAAALRQRFIRELRWYTDMLDVFYVY